MPARRHDKPETLASAEHDQSDAVPWIDAELDRLGQLPPNWDRYGAPAIDQAVIAAARQFVRRLPEPLTHRPRVVPLSTGNLQLEWHKGAKVLELEFEDARTIRYLQWHPEAGVEEEDTFPITDINKAVDLIRWFTNGNGA